MSTRRESAIVAPPNIARTRFIVGSTKTTLSERGRAMTDMWMSSTGLVMDLIVADASTRPGAVSRGVRTYASTGSRLPLSGRHALGPDAPGERAPDERERGGLDDRGQAPRGGEPLLAPAPRPPRPAPWGRGASTGSSAAGSPAPTCARC